MIQIHDPAAVVCIEVFLLLAMLLALHRVTEGRLWAWLGYGLSTRGRFRAAAGAVVVLCLAAAVFESGGVAGLQVGRALARAFFAVLMMMPLAIFLVLRQKRRAHAVQVQRYQVFIDGLKRAADPAAADTIRAAIMALNRGGVTVVDLSDCRLQGADLGRVRLHGADLRNAELSRANLKDVGFSGADLNGARLIEADLRDAFFYRADLRGADLSRADLRGADLREADLRNACLDGCRLKDARLEDARLDGASFSQAEMENTQVSVAQLLKTETLSHAILEPELRARLVAAQNPPGSLARRLLRLDGTVPLWPA